MKTFISIVISLILFAIAMIFGGGCSLSAKDQEDRHFKHCIEHNSLYNCNEFIRVTSKTEAELRRDYTADGIKELTGKREQARNRATSIQQEENTAIEQYKSSSNTINK